MPLVHPPSHGPTAADEPCARVSVVMPFLDAERFIAESIESVLAQTYDAWELLLVDDGSCDTSPAIARAYAQAHPSRIRHFEHPGRANRGPSASRNLGFAHARGEYIALLDADDIWLPEKLAQQIPILDAHREVGALYGNTRYWFSWTGDAEDRAEDFLPELGVADATIMMPPELLTRCLAGTAAVPCTCSIVMRRAVVEAVGGFQEEFRYVFTDQAFYTKLLLTTPVYVSASCWDWYRRHPESACAITSQRGETDAKRLQYLRWTRDYLRTHGHDRGALGRVVHREIRRHERPRLHRLLSRVHHVWQRLRRVASLALTSS
jgi:glycosyltransferase involved in cell wall biosynthesis